MFCLQELGALCHDSGFIARITPQVAGRDKGWSHLGPEHRVVVGAQVLPEQVLRYPGLPSMMDFTAIQSTHDVDRLFSSTERMLVPTVVGDELDLRNSERFDLRLEGPLQR